MKKRLFSVFLLLTSLAFAQGYRPPNMEKKIFDTSKLEIDKISKSALFTGLVSIARDFDEEDHEVEYDLRSNALAIAGRLEPESDTFKDTAAQLEKNGRTIPEDNDKSDVSSKIYRGVRVLMKKKDNEDNKKCASYCIDIALRLDPEGRRAKQLEEYQEETGKAKWKDMLGDEVVPDGPWWGGGSDDNVFKEREESIPGGKAEKFAAVQRSVYGLSVRQLSNGRHAGAASSLSATALRDADAKEEDLIVFHIDQKVGNMTGNSLEEIKKLMRVRHEAAGRIPTGYKVEIAFEDKDGLLDGPSAGTAMSIILDSLFTGLELDDSFAVTGAITADGKVTPIGGVAGKIRGATRKGMKFVGVPHENIKGVSDILVLDGIEKLMNIQVFSFKTLDEAIMVASKEKPKHVQQTIDDFSRVAELIKDTKGEAKQLATLRSGSVIALLEKVVEKMPNHQSARILLSVAKSEEKKTISLGGSFHQITTRVNSVASKLSRMMFMEKLAINAADRTEAKEAAAELEEVSSKLDPRLKEYNESMIEVMKIYSGGRDDDEEDKEFLKRLKKKWDEAGAQRKKLMEDPEIMEELMN